MSTFAAISIQFLYIGINFINKSIIIFIDNCSAPQPPFYVFEDQQDLHILFSTEFAASDDCFPLYVTCMCIFFKRSYNNAPFGKLCCFNSSEDNGSWSLYVGISLQKKIYINVWGGAQEKKAVFLRFLKVAGKLFITTVSKKNVQKKKWRRQWWISTTKSSTISG